jgi:enamine deaminase RidA (YjgF/YER057c/UK114 family)
LRVSSRIGIWRRSSTPATSCSCRASPAPDLISPYRRIRRFRDAFRFVRANLAAAGLDLSHVVEMTTYHVGLRKHLDAFIKVKDEFVSAPYPAWTAVGVSELITPGTLVEIRVIASRR